MRAQRLIPGEEVLYNLITQNMASTNYARFILRMTEFDKVNVGAA